MMRIRSLQGISSKRLKQDFPRVLPRMPSSARYPKNAAPVPWNPWLPSIPLFGIYICWKFCGKYMCCIDKSKRRPRLGPPETQPWSLPNNTSLEACGYNFFFIGLTSGFLESDQGKVLAEVTAVVGYWLYLGCAFMLKKCRRKDISKARILWSSALIYVVCVRGGQGLWTSVEFESRAALGPVPIEHWSRPFTTTNSPFLIVVRLTGFPFLVHSPSYTSLKCQGPAKINNLIEISIFILFSDILYIITIFYPIWHKNSRVNCQKLSGLPSTLNFVFFNICSSSAKFAASFKCPSKAKWSLDRPGQAKSQGH